MAYDNNGILSKNRKKEKDTHPDINGSATIEGVEYWLSGWAKTGKNGPFYSLAFKRKDQQGQGGNKPAAAPASTGLDDDEIPF